MFVLVVVRRLERSIAAAFSSEATKKRASTGPLLSWLLRVPQMVRGFSVRSLTSPLSAARRRCFEWLTEDADDDALDKCDWTGSLLHKILSG